MGLLKFLIIAILVLWIIRVIFRMIFPVMLKSVFGSMQNQAAGSHQQQQQQQRSSKPEGSISIDYMPKKEKKGNADHLGDFVDYEEVKQ
jgi:hypothetical protein